MGRFLARAAGWYAAIFLWNLLTISPISPGNSWQGLSVSFVLLALSGYRLAQTGVRSSWYFIYGVGAAVVFLPRMFFMDRYHLWVQQFAGLGDLRLAVWWLAASLLFGMLCWCAAQLRLSNAELLLNLPAAAQVGEVAKPSERLQLKHLLIWTACVAAYFAVTNALTFERFAPSRMPGGFAVLVGMFAVAAATSIFGLLVFVARRINAIRYPKWPGEFLLLSLAAASVFSLVGRAIQYTLAPERTVMPSPDSLDALFTAGKLIAALVLLSGWHRSSLLWRLFFISDSLLLIVDCFSLRLIQSPLYSAFSFLPTAVLVAAVISDRYSQHRFTWTHGLGVATQLWVTCSRLIGYVIQLAARW